MNKINSHGHCLKGYRAPLCVIASLALVSAMVPVASGAIFDNQGQALADSSVSNSSALAPMSDAAPSCVQTCISGYLDGTISKATLKSSLEELAADGLITNSQLNTYLAYLSDDDIEALKSCCASSEENTSSGSSDEEGSSEEGDSNDEDKQGTDDSSTDDENADNNGDGQDNLDGDDSQDTESSDGEEASSGATESEPTESVDESKSSDSDSSAATNAGTSKKDKTSNATSSSAKKKSSTKSLKHPLSDSANKNNDKSDKSASTSSKRSAQTVKVSRATHDLTTEQFIAVIGEQARQIGQDKGIYASVMIAQAILESGSGSSLLSSAPFYNLFGIKGSFNDNGVTMKTKEYDSSGNEYTTSATFRDYSSYTESLNDYANLLTEERLDVYYGALKQNAETPYEAAEYLQGRYATSTSYAASLTALIDTYDLTRYDEALPYEPDEEYLVETTDADGNKVTEKRTIADLLAIATTYLGTDYVWGGNTPEVGFDCSGFVQYAYSTALGVNLPRTTYVQCQVGEEVQLDDLHPGDLLFFESDGDVHHVGMYLGNGFFIHAPQSGDVVKVTALEDYAPSFAMRVISTHERGKKSSVNKSEALEDAANDIVNALDSVSWNMMASISDSVATVIDNG